MGTKRKRQQFSEAARRDAVAAWRASGESADAYSRRTGIGKSNLWRWSRVFGSDGPGGTDGRGAAVAAAPGAAPRTSFAAVRVIETDGAASGSTAEQALMCELDGPRGVRIRVYQGIDAQALRLLLDVVRGDARC